MILKALAFTRVAATPRKERSIFFKLTIISRHLDCCNLNEIRCAARIFFANFSTVSVLVSFEYESFFLSQYILAKRLHPTTLRNSSFWLNIVMLLVFHYYIMVSAVHDCKCYAGHALWNSVQIDIFVMIVDFDFIKRPQTDTVT